MGNFTAGFDHSKFGADLKAGLAKLQIPVYICQNCGKYSDELVLDVNANLGWNIPKVEVKPINMNFNMPKIEMPKIVMKPVDLTIKVPTIQANVQPVNVNANYNLNAGGNMNAGSNYNAGVDINANSHYNAQVNLNANANQNAAANANFSYST